MNGLEKVAKRHADIPQDMLPLDIPQSDLGGGDDVRTTAQKSIKWAKCPHHVADPLRQLTGLIAIDNKTLAFRDHTKRVGRQTLPCSGSGLVWEGETSDHPR